MPQLHPAIPTPRPAFGNSPSVKSAKPQTDAQFEIHSLDWMEIHRPFGREAWRLNCFEVIWIKQGSGTLTVDCKKYEIRDNVIFFLSPGHVRLMQAAGPMEGYYMAMSAEFLYLADEQADFSFFDATYAGDRNVLACWVELEMQRELEEIVVRMTKEFANFYLLRSALLAGLLKIFLIYLSRKFSSLSHDPAIPDRDVQLMGKFSALLKKHFTTWKMVADYASALNVTPNYLNQIVKKVSGFSASHHIQQYIILEAKRQALHMGVSMKDIAYQLGFSDIAHFSKYFKKSSGMNFSSFKKEMRQSR